MVGTSTDQAITALGRGINPMHLQWELDVRRRCSRSRLLSLMIMLFIAVFDRKETLATVRVLLKNRTDPRKQENKWIM